MTYVSPHLPKKPSKAQMLDQLARRTGLPRNTVKELLKAGWVYRESINQPPAFLSPIVRMEDRHASVPGN